MQEIDLFDFLSGQVQELALAYGDDLQMGFEQRIVPRPQRGQETIAPMLVLIRIHWADLSAVLPKKPVDHGAALTLSGPAVLNLQNC